MSDSPGPDEVLAEPSGPRWLSTDRRRRVVAALSVLGLIALLGIRLALGHRSAHRATPSHAPTPQPAVNIGPSPVDVTPGRPNFRAHDPAFCPDTITCENVDPLPAGVLAAIRSYLPHARVGSETTVVQSDPRRLYFRQLDASADNITVVLRISRTARSPTLGPTQATDRLPGQSIGYVRTVTGDGFVVEVRFTGLPAYRPPMTDIRALAADPRLLALD